MIRRAASLAVVLTMLAVAGARGQRLTTTLTSGTVVRLHRVDSSVAVGRLLAPFGPDSTVFRYCKYPAPPCTATDSPLYQEELLANIRQIEIKTGSRSGRGALIGVGVLAALLGTAAVVSQGEPFEGRPANAGLVVAFLSLSAGMFAGIGALIGSGTPTWGPAP